MRCFDVQCTLIEIFTYTENDVQRRFIKFLTLLYTFVCTKLNVILNYCRMDLQGCYCFCFISKITTNLENPDIDYFQNCGSTLQQKFYKTKQFLNMNDPKVCRKEIHDYVWRRSSDYKKIFQKKFHQETLWKKKGTVKIALFHYTFLILLSKHLKNLFGETVCF